MPVSLTSAPFWKLSSNREHIEDMFFEGILTNFSSILNQAFKIFEEKCMRQEGGLYFYWHVSAAYGLVQSKLDHESSASSKLEATDRVAELYHKMLAFQEAAPEKPPPTMAIPSAAVPRSEAGFQFPGSWFYSASANALGVRDSQKSSANLCASLPFLTSTLVFCCGEM
jgi:hypothetical protein